MHTLLLRPLGIAVPFMRSTGQMVHVVLRARTSSPSFTAPNRPIRITGLAKGLARMTDFELGILRAILTRSREFCETLLRDVDALRDRASARETTSVPSIDHPGRAGLDILTVKQVASRLQCSTNQVYDLIRTKQIPAIRLGGWGWRIRAVDLERVFIASRRTALPLAECRALKAT